MSAARHVFHNINVAEFDGMQPVFVRRDVTVADGIVEDVGEPTPCRGDHSSKVLFPKFFNLHCHLGESLFRGISGRDWTLRGYLQYTEKFQNGLSAEERETAWTQSALSVLKDCGQADTVGICASRSASVCARSGFKNMSGFPIMNTPKVIGYKNSGVGGFVDYMRRYKNERCSVGVFLHSLYLNDDKSLELAAAAMSNGAEFLTAHISEDLETRKMECEKFGKAPVDVLNSYGLIGENTVLVHGGYLDGRELDTVAQKHAVLAVCPISNAFLNTRTVNIHDLTSRGIEWAIATDGLATGRTFDMLKQAVFLKKLFPDLSYAELFYRMTAVPAKLYHRPCYTGRIEKGVSAEFIVRDMTDDPLADLFAAGDGFCEEDVYASVGS